MRLAVLAGVALWAGATLLLAELRWFHRPSLTERLKPYAPGGMTASSRAGILSMESFRDVIAPLSQSVGRRLAAVFGVREDVATRLERIHSPLDATAFRVRELGRMTLAMATAGLVILALQPAPPLALCLLLGAPLLAFLLAEQRLSARSADWQRRLFLELPIVGEQLAMLLSAGFSLGSALNRIAARGSGATSRDLQRVCGRIRQGLSEIDALSEWAAVADVPALHRLIPVLALNREATDLGRLLSQEARAIRRDVHRQLAETMERRGQQVWIPVTVATLVPGVIFLAIPFIEALRLFAGS